MWPRDDPRWVAAWARVAADVRAGRHPLGIALGVDPWGLAQCA